MAHNVDSIAGIVSQFGKFLFQYIDIVVVAAGDAVDYTKMDKIVIGVCGGDGIGPTITAETARVLEHLLADEVKAGRIEFRTIEGLTIENRIAKGKAIPDDVMAELKACHIILKGPTTTPQKGSGMPNIESANVAMPMSFFHVTLPPRYHIRQTLMPFLYSTTSMYSPKRRQPSGSV